jgi:predicted ATPase
MSKIRIKNFGPIKEGLQDNDGWIDIKKVTVFIGNQGSGKSTVAKLISTLSWIEKSLYKENSTKSEVKRKPKFQNYYCDYQNLKNYFNQNSEIEYVGDAFTMHYKEGRLNIQDNRNSRDDYAVPKIMYVPAERNFVSAVSQPDKLKYLPKPLYTFLDEFERSKQELSESISLPINNLKFHFDKKKSESKIIGNNHEILLSEGSSGLQSLIPLFLVSKNLAEGINNVSDNSKNKASLDEMKILRQRVFKVLTNPKLTEELRLSAIEILSSLTKNDCFINIVEEPEQNLFPTSQWSMLKSLLKFNNMEDDNKLIMTTHSPYIINYLTLAIKAKFVYQKIINSNNTIELIKKLEDVVPLTSLVKSEDVLIYELNEVNGTIKKLKDYEGLPSDENYLNEKMAENNEMFTHLLEIEDLCQ